MQRRKVEYLFSRKFREKLDYLRENTYCISKFDTRSRVEQVRNELSASIIRRIYILLFIMYSILTVFVLSMFFFTNYYFLFALVPVHFLNVLIKDTMRLLLRVDFQQLDQLVNRNCLLQGKRI